MAFNGTGTFVRNYSWIQDAANGIVVDATRMDNDTNDIASGLSDCVTRDGQSPALANLPMGGFKFTGLANGAVSTDSVNYGQVFSSPTFTTPRALATPALGSNSTLLATTAYVDQTAFAATLPSQSLGLLYSTGSVASFTQTLTGFALNEAHGADIPSAATLNLQTATGNLVDVTGTTTITAITLSDGAERTVRFTGILTLTNGASLLLPGAANITTTAGDFAIFRGYAAGIVRCVEYTKISGLAVVTTAIPIPNGYINGFAISNDSGTPNTKLDIAAGYAADSTNSIMITGTTFVKSTAGTWVSGTNNNGMGTGLTIANSTWYHVFAITNAGAYDVYFDTSITAANAPASTTAKRYVGSFRTNGSANIIPFLQTGQKFRWTTAITDLSGGTASTPTAVTLSTPLGIKTFPLLSVRFSAATTAGDYAYVDQIGTANVVSSDNNDIGMYAVAASVGQNTQGQTTTNTSSQVNYLINRAGGATLSINTLGYVNPYVAVSP